MVDGESYSRLRRRQKRGREFLDGEGEHDYVRKFYADKSLIKLPLLFHQSPLRERGTL
jgi:hypothetical protein